jgi:Zn-dependent protease with chaperone function/RNA polymerase subunit RPABC4/transcription elongation factor Spt4
MFCKACGKQIPDDSRFCKFCGAPLSNDILCKACNSWISADSRFCKHCGTPVREDKIPAPGETAPAQQSVPAQQQAIEVRQPVATTRSVAKVEKVRSRSQRKKVVKLLRHRWEKPVFLLTILPFAMWVLFSGSSTVCMGFLIFCVVWLVLYLRLRMNHARMLAHGVKGSPTQLPHVWRCVERCSSRLPLNLPVDVIVVQSAELNAFTFGVRKPYSIVLTSGLVKALDQDELTSVIAHEWGHLLLGHTLLGSLFSALAQGGLVLMQMSTVVAQATAAESDQRNYKRSGGERAIVAILAAMATLLAPIVFLAHRRLSEISADRVSVLVLGNADKPVTALAKIAVGPELAEHLNESELIAQAEQLGKDIFGMVQQLLGDHPFVGGRLKAMRTWIGSPEYSELAALLSQ